MFRVSRNENEKFYPYNTTPRRSNLKNSEDKPIISEWKVALIALIFSVFVLICKVLHANSDYIKQKVFDEHLITYETITADGEVMFRHGWKTAVRYSRFWLPALCGLLTTMFTWLMVYLDSNVPGVQPPSPFSPSKYKTSSGHAFHLNYIFSVLIGLMVFLYMYWKGVSIEF